MRGNDNNPVNLDSFGHIFLRPFYTRKSEDSEHGGGRGSSHHYGSWALSLGHPSLPAGVSPSVLVGERASGLKMQESRLQGYQLEGATLEHILAARCAEGFSVLSITEDRGSGRGLGGQGETSKHFDPETIVMAA
jgi:hypothetical protein